jgi:hypothetical protein
VRFEIFNFLEVRAKQPFHFRDSGIAATQPNDFRRRAALQSQIRKILAQRHDHKTIFFCVLPDDLIIGGAEIKEPRLRGIGKDVRQPPDKFVAQVMVEQQLHAA